MRSYFYAVVDGPDIFNKHIEKFIAEVRSDGYKLFRIEEDAPESGTDRGDVMQNPHNQKPKISKSAWISETAVILGNVTIGDDVFVAPNAVIRADEPGSSIVIENMCNVQDNVVVHGLADSDVIVGKNTSLAHGCIVHGPCRIGEGCFIGFGAVVFDCTIGNDTVVLHNTTVRGVGIPAGKVVSDGQVVTSQDDANSLLKITDDLANFKKGVVAANLDLLEMYRKLSE